MADVTWEIEDPQAPENDEGLEVQAKFENAVND